MSNVTDWNKVFEVFGSGVIGVYLIMTILMVLTQLGMKAVEYIENWHKGEEPNQKP